MNGVHSESKTRALCRKEQSLLSSAGLVLGTLAPLPVGLDERQGARPRAPLPVDRDGRQGVEVPPACHLPVGQDERRRLSVNEKQEARSTPPLPTAGCATAAVPLAPAPSSFRPPPSTPPQTCPGSCEGQSAPSLICRRRSWCAPCRASPGPRPTYRRRWYASVGRMVF